jgi:hypothetical protein
MATKCRIIRRVVTCTFCGLPTASASRRYALATVSCCHACAIDVLPKLIAKALFAEYRHQPDLIGTMGKLIDRAVDIFWLDVAFDIYLDSLSVHEQK